MQHQLLKWVGRAAGLALVLGILLLWQLLLPRWVNSYIQQVIILAGINIILAVSLNLVNGITGQFSLGHAGFMALGAYSSAAFTYYAGPRLNLLDPVIFALALCIGAAVAGLAGLLVGLPSLRLRGDYLAIVTLGFGQIIVSLITTINEVRGARGFTGLPAYTSFVWVYGLVLLCFLTVRNLADSALGRSMRAVRDDEVAAEAVGVNTTRIKVLAFVISAMWAGVAGALQAHYIQSAHPGSFGFMKSVEIVVMVVLGGLGSITGATIAAVMLKLMEEVLRTVGGAFGAMILLILVAAALSLPRNLERWRRGSGSLLPWLAGPTVALATICFVNFAYQDWLQGQVAYLRFVIYALILIVLMLQRPQGLLGRHELSLAWRHRD